MRAVALRYALAPACIVLAALLQLSPAGPTLNPTGLFAIAVLAAAWFGGAGPGLMAAVLATFTLPQVIAVSYPLLGGVLDLPRFITFSIAGLAVGWWSFRRRQTEAALRDQERYARAMNASDDGFWDWIPADDTIYTSPRLLEIYGFAFGTSFAGRNDLLAQLPFHPEDRPQLMRAFAEHFAGKTVRYDVETRLIRDGETRWVHLTGMAARHPDGTVVRWTGTVRDVTERKRAELARKRSEEALRNSEQRYALAMEAAGDGHTDWDLVSGEFYISPRLLEIVGHAPGTSFADRADWVRRFPFHPEDRPKWEAAVAAHFAGRGSHFKMELRIVVRGEVRWTAFHFLSTRDAAGRPIRWTGSVGDITERKQAEQALRESEARKSAMFETALDCIVSIDHEGRVVEFNPAAERTFGYRRAEALGKELAELIIPARLRAQHRQGLARYLKTGEGPVLGKRTEMPAVRADGSEFPVELSVTRIATEGAALFTAYLRDITERKRIEEALLQSEERYERVVAATQAGFWDWDVVQDKYYVSPRLLEMAGLPPGTIIAGRADFQARVPIHPEDLEKWQQAIKALFESSGSRLSTELRVMLGGGTRWYRVDGVCFRNAAGDVVRWTGSAIDVTPRKLAEEALRASEQRYSLAMEGSQEGHFDVNADTGDFFASERVNEICGFPSGTRFAKRAEYLAQLRLHRDDLERYHATVAGVMAKDGPDHFDFEYRIVRPSGEVRWLRTRGKVTRDAEGRARRRTGTVADVTEAKLAEEALRKSEQRYELAMAASESGYWDWDIPTDRYFVSPRAYELAGFPFGTTWASRDDYKAHINMHPEDFAGWEAAREALFAGTGERLAMEVRYVVNGEVRWHMLNAICKRDDTGKVIRWTGSATDITERKLAQEGLEMMEPKLRQAQRLEAMGTLAGGIAHDFNNILGAILGYGEMALRDAPKGSRLARDLDSIMIAGDRGRALVDRVLAFSRSAVGERVPVHVERVVREALDLVSAKLPPAVTVHAELHAGPAAVLGDATQVHQVVANLATNAIQAMPTGGTLRVELAVARVEGPRVATIGGLPAGEYVVLTVADTGGGIAPEIVDRIFDPFFTTKEVGTGTGLGLSLVHGIVTELGGCIDVISKAGAGTTFVVYLPRSGEAPEAEQDAQLALPRGDGQRVLVVDDEEPLVQIATRTLEELGYAPVGFTSSGATLATFRADPQRFDVLITDERMPGMSGSALIREVRGIRSSLPVVLMTGYLGATAGKAHESGLVDEVLQKPLSARDLATSLARVLRLHDK